MDAVITYVNGSDSEWQRQYGEFCGQPILAKRYRDWGLLPFLLRGIEQCMPFIENVFIVVAFESQVPEWIDRSRVRIVYHRDIIPQEFLPTFNSGTIEIFLHRIEGLAEQFVYFNDDIFPVRPMNPNQFFDNNKIIVHYARHCLALNKYKKRVRSADRFARLAAERKGYHINNCPIFIRPQHTCTPMLREESEQMFATIETELLGNISVLRTSSNPNQYVYTDYLYYIGQAINRRISTKHCSMATCTHRRVANSILKPSTDLVCINDVSMSEQRKEQMQETLLEAFKVRFPSKSRFEK